MGESIKKIFNHLKIHTQYSICEGALKIEDLKNYCKENKIKSLGLSDTSNLFGALEFSEKISKSGTQPIIGTQIKCKIDDTTGLLPLFALNEIGYKNIIDLSSSSYLNNDKLSDQKNIIIMFNEGVDAMKKRGKADLGEKTMLDVLIPVSIELKKLFDEENVKSVAEKIKEVAEKGMLSTKNLIATKGRSSFLGERAKGHIDPGARSSQLAIEAICNTIINT